MTIEYTISAIKRELIRVFALLDEWFDREHDFLVFKPLPERWSAAEVLEHIMLTDHYLLKLIDRGCEKALLRAKNTNLREALQTYDFSLPALEEVSDPASFVWDRPQHMMPTGAPLREIRVELRIQLYRCLCILERLKAGEGVLHKTTMTVNNLGKLDVYQYIYFLALHARRHLRQLESNEKEFHQQAEQRGVTQV